jgi:predicted nucleic acid-binding protein
MDLMIASIVIANNEILITNNTKQCANIPNLEIKNWS